MPVKNVIRKFDGCGLHASAGVSDKIGVSYLLLSSLSATLPSGSESLSEGNKRHR